MKSSLPRCFPKGLVRSLHIATLVIAFGGIAFIQAATNKSPVLVSESTSTRAIALESVTLKPEPFDINSTVKYSSDTRTRIAVFAMNLEMLAGEAGNSFNADMQDGTGKRYPVTVEYSSPLPGFPGITMLIIRLSDDMAADSGDVLLQVSLHGMASNRVRVAIGHVGGGPSNDSGAVPTPAPTTPDPADPVFVPDTYTGAASDADTVRFLEQASWGPTAAEVTRVKAMGFRAYLDEQLNAPVLNPGKGSNYPDPLPWPSPSPLMLDAISFVPDDSSVGCPTGSPAECGRDNYTQYQIQKQFYRNALYGPDQLRQRVAWALHQILVVSERDELTTPSRVVPYLQALDRGAFGNFRTLLNEITLTPAMGHYLDMRLSTRTNANENFAREILQLFTIGTVKLNRDGSPQLDATGAPLATYTQTNVNEFTRVFTGWNFAAAFTAGITNYRDPMVPRGGTNHDFNAKTLLNGTTTTACSNQSGNPNILCAQSDLTVALDNLFNHPNVGPFIGKQLIQHLVTSNPSRGYVDRVARVFNNDCDGLYPLTNPCTTNARGNMKAVVQAILLDPEARGDVKTASDYGRLRDPAHYVVGFLRATNVKSFDKTSTSDGVLGSRSTTDFAGTLDQVIFQPPTVFSYYHPDYEVPGTKILGPAFQILSTSTTLRRANIINTLIYTGVSATTTSTDRPRGTSIDLANLEALASNPGNIADALNALMLHGTMSTQMRNSIITVMNGIPTSDANFARKRAQTAVYLVATSSQYDVQR
jgi:uncharacterized protein (DUF1800 family)